MLTKIAKQYSILDIYRDVIRDKLSTVEKAKAMKSPEIFL
jgi:hypothetical protein